MKRIFNALNVFAMLAIMFFLLVGCFTIFGNQQKGIFITALLFNIVAAYCFCASKNYFSKEGR